MKVGSIDKTAVILFHYADGILPPFPVMWLTRVRLPALLNWKGHWPLVVTLCLLSATYKHVTQSNSLKSEDDSIFCVSAL